MEDPKDIIKKFLKENAKKGGAALLKKRGTSHFSAIAKARWDKQKAVENQEKTNE